MRNPILGFKVNALRVRVSVSVRRCCHSAKNKKNKKSQRLQDSSRLQTSIFISFNRQAKGSFRKKKKKQHRQKDDERRDGRRNLSPSRADACLLNFVRAPPKSAVSGQGSMRSAFDWMSLAVIRRRGDGPAPGLRAH